jgi:hypothetical protein
MNRFLNFIRINNIKPGRPAKNQFAILCFECCVIIEFTILQIVGLIVIDDRKNKTGFVLFWNNITYPSGVESKSLMIIFQNI